MNEFLNRQRLILLDAIAQYKKGSLHLNSFLRRLEGITDIVALQSWDEKVFPILSLMEEINAAAIDEKRSLTCDEEHSIENCMASIEAAANRYLLYLNSEKND